jgi:hypothetical protein
MESGSYQLESGRKVFLKRLRIDGTFAGHMEGSPESVSGFVLRNTPSNVQRDMRPGQPLVVIQTDEMPLPDFRFIAEFESRRGVRQTDPDYSSRLFVCWFQGDLSRSLDELMSNVLERVDWEANAEDFDIMGYF